MRVPTATSGRGGRRGGYALVLILTLVGVSLLVLGSAMLWSINEGRLIERNNQYFRSVAAAEAASEKVVTEIAVDYHLSGEPFVQSKLDTYRLRVPTAGEDNYWGNYQFEDGQGGIGQTFVKRNADWADVDLPKPFNGLRGLGTSYRVISNAREVNSPYAMTGAVKQDLQLSSIPIFQFGIFYALDLEIHPVTNWTLNGWTHSNADIYSQPEISLTFQKKVTAVGRIKPNKKSGDPLVRGSGSITFQGKRQTGVNSLLLPAGLTNPPASLRALIEIPPVGEPIGSPLGQQRYYNKADLIVVISDTSIVVKTGATNGFLTLPWFNPALTTPQVSDFIQTNIFFYDKREQKTIAGVDIDINLLLAWNLLNETLRPVLGGNLRILYIADLRTQTAGTQTGIRLIHGQTLLPEGLTIVTPNPLYVKGDYNIPVSTPVPASLAADSVTVLSENWDDLNGHLGLNWPLGTRVAVNTTVNAAILTGVVPTGGGYYSGGVENLIRLLEDWTGKTLTYNGSLVAMFESVIAVGPWGQPDTYLPPDRPWSHDINFDDFTRLPPGTPHVQVACRAAWETVAPNSSALY
jgi:hypothetical protein